MQSFDSKCMSLTILFLVKTLCFSPHSIHSFVRSSYNIHEMSSLLSLALLLLLSRAPLITLQQEQDPSLTYCSNETGNYTSNSQFSSNLWNTLLPSVASDAPVNLSSYAYSSVGQGPDRVFGFAQCMSAAAAQDCRVCLNQSLAAIARLCPNRKQAVVRYDNCILRYSNQSFISLPDTIFLATGTNQINATEPDVFLRQLGVLMKNLSRESAQSPSRFAVGSTDYNYLFTIYGMAQCTMDLPVTACSNCLDWVISYINNNTGARLYFPSCSIRYEIFAFYPAVGLPPPPSQPSPPPREAPSSNSGGNTSTRRNIIIGVTLAAVLVLVIVIVSIRCASKRTHTRLLKEDDDQRSASFESAQPTPFKLNEIGAATCSSLDANKLGEGGFGAVYKGKPSDGQELDVK